MYKRQDNMLRELTDKNLTYLHMWSENLQNISGEDEIRDYIKKAQENAGVLEFFFLSDGGNYKMATGETGYLGLQENIEAVSYTHLDVYKRQMLDGSNSDPIDDAVPRDDFIKGNTLFMLGSQNGITD